MTGTDIIILLILVMLVFGAVWKIRKDKRRGAPCTGCSACPMAGSCDAPIKKK